MSSTEQRDHWLLPEGIEDVLPGEALHREQVRRRLLDHFHGWGFEYVIPPMLEFLTSLLTGTGRDLDIKTLKVTDQMSGRTLGIRADMTPQVARIDAHSLNREGPVRLCYAGTVLHSRPDNMLASRAPTMVGAELFGDSSHQADVEIVCLMVESLQSFDKPLVHLELGDVSIYRDLVSTIDVSHRAQIFDLIQKKAHADLAVAAKKATNDEALIALLVELPKLCGDDAVLTRARELFAGHEKILEQIANLQLIADGVRSRFDNVNIYFDLSELRGYDYHTGIVFASYLNGTRVAKGGRYDAVGEVFGRRRSATGFDVHVAGLAAETEPKTTKTNHGRIRVTATSAADPACWEVIVSLRAQGEIVIEDNSGVIVCDSELVSIDGNWRVQALERKV